MRRLPLPVSASRAVHQFCRRAAATSRGCPCRPAGRVCIQGCRLYHWLYYSIPTEGIPKWPSGTAKLESRLDLGDIRIGPLSKSELPQCEYDMITDTSRRRRKYLYVRRKHPSVILDAKRSKEYKRREMSMPISGQWPPQHGSARSQEPRNQD